jgi:uroporphyrinogen-III synthase
MANDSAIIVTRPSGQARRLIELVRGGAQAQGSPVDVLGLPLLTIVPKNDFDTVTAISKALTKAKLIIFISPNAIECTMRAIADAGIVWNELVNPQTFVGVVGHSSRDALLRHGLDPQTIIMPALVHQSDSEGLWQSLQDHIQDWQRYPVLILKGDGGRESLMDHLQAVGAHVEALSIYTRIPLDASSKQWELVRGLHANTSLWVLTSSEAVRHLGNSLPSCIKSQALCSHPNIAKVAQEIGFTQVVVCDPGDESIAQAALAWLVGQARKSPSPTADDR